MKTIVKKENKQLSGEQILKKKIDDAREFASKIDWDKFRKSTELHKRHGTISK